MMPSALPHCSRTIVTGTIVTIVMAAMALGCRAREAAEHAGTSAASATTAVPAAALPVLTGVAVTTPVDEAPRDSLLVATRDSLFAIIVRRDTAALLTYLDPAVKYSFGGDEGRDGFLDFWREYYSLDAMWRTLQDVLAHGGRFIGPTLFAAPWMYTALPDSLEVFEHLVVRDTLVAVRLAASDTASPIGTLSHTVVRASAMELQPRDSLWRAVVLADNRTAFVPAAHVRSPVDWRVGLGFENGRWTIQFFVAGD